MQGLVWEFGKKYKLQDVTMLSGFTVYYHIDYALSGPVYIADMKLLEKTAPQVHPEFIGGHFIVKRTKRRFRLIRQLSG